MDVKMKAVLMGACILIVSILSGLYINILIVEQLLFMLLFFGLVLVWEIIVGFFGFRIYSNYIAKQCKVLYSLSNFWCNFIKKNSLSITGNSPLTNAPNSGHYAL